MMIKAVRLKWNKNNDANRPVDSIIVLDKAPGRDFCVFRSSSKALYLYGSGADWYFYPIYYGSSALCNVSGLGQVSKDKFMSELSERYPEDFEWLLWHPEILEGRYDD